MSGAPIEIALGPLLFNWSADRIADFYAAIADESEIDRVYLGEVVCGKREPFIFRPLAEAAERLTRAGKTVVWSTLALPATPRDRRGMAQMAADETLVEINDVSALAHRPLGAPFVAGPLLNIYNEAAARELIGRGCVRLCPNVELSLAAIGRLAQSCPGLEIELFAYGRLPLALSGRCYHARVRGLHKDACQLVCDRDPDGLTVRTLEGQDFLAVNGVQTLSHGVQVADLPITQLRAAGIGALRLSPQTGDMRKVITAFRDFSHERLSPQDLAARVREAGPPGPLVNGYLHGRAGVDWAPTS
ncbi:MAG: U32 family peptidase [Phenylobacterium sp.]|jgi:collagenase-like PrtC family protease|uniref:ubiquinone anaerobic biosynthesis protein UbiV n=1 Tax=Phenylobacterium sp. TaxID=1871053 RepID=UPI001B569D2B|nr:U32 family peptidase [Phenylobacterium sp.]MBP7817396.1 U32 family peptidase [Phenylobacterium sp.]MBP9231043.1 U32 family peptidase [Phenylobacterium sp.]MBP9755225.1 U32 family peptidase [Phenylobacterium sp.]